MVWSHVSDGFQQITSSNGMDSARLQEEEGCPRVSRTPTIQRDLDLDLLARGETMDLRRDAWTGETVLRDALLQHEEGLSAK